MWTRLRAVVALMPILAAAAWAEPVSLSPAALHVRPAPVAVDPQNVTVVQFCNAIAWSAYKASWLHATVSPQDKRVLLLDASATSGEVALMVWVEGDNTPLQFTVRVSARALANHVYFVGCTDATAETPKPPPPAASPGPAISPRHPSPHTRSLRAPAPGTSASDQTGAWDTFAATLSPRQWALLTRLVTSPSDLADTAFPAPSPSEPGSGREQSDLVRALHPHSTAGLPVRPISPSSNELPRWLSWQAAGASGEDAILVTYTVANTGPNPVILDVARLEVLDDHSARVPQKSVSRMDTSGVQGRIPPGGVESGVIYVPDPPEGGTTIRWPALELYTGLTYVLLQTIK